MRKILLVTCAALSVLGMPTAASAGSFNQRGQFVGTVSPRVTALLRQFPQGGSQLADAIAALLEADPSLAAGLAEAAGHFASLRNQPGARAAELTILAALRFADGAFRAAFDADLAPIIAEEVGGRAPPIFVPGGGGGGVGGSGCVSRST